MSLKLSLFLTVTSRIFVRLLRAVADSRIPGDRGAVSYPSDVNSAAYLHKGVQDPPILGLGLHLRIDRARAHMHHGNAEAVVGARWAGLVGSAGRSLKWHGLRGAREARDSTAAERRPIAPKIATTKLDELNSHIHITSSGRDCTPPFPISLERSLENTQKHPAPALPRSALFRSRTKHAPLKTLRRNIARLSLNLRRNTLLRLLNLRLFFTRYRHTIRSTPTIRTSRHSIEP